MDWTYLLTFALALAVAAASPGPGIAAVVARALGSGLRPALPMIAGLVTGDIVFLACAVLGLAVIATQFGTLFVLIRYAGAAYLLYLAYCLWTTNPITTDIKARTAGGPWRMYMAGLLVTLGNPKVIVFYLALVPTFLDLRVVSAAGFIALAGVITVVLSAVLVAYAALAARARGLFRSAVARRRINRTAGTAMAGAAVAIASR